MQKKDISIVIPLFNEEESLPELISWIDAVMNKQSFDYDIILVDDGSKDNSWETIKTLSHNNPHITALRLRSNSGKSAALHAGFQIASGDVVITMDADLQDSPEEIPFLYKMIQENNFDMVSGWKKMRHDPLNKTIPSKLFNAVTRMVSGIQLHDFNCGLKAYKQDVIKSIEVYGEMHRYIPVIAKKNGFTKIGEKIVQHQARKYGVTKFGMERFLYGFLDLLSISFVSKFRKSPMHFFGSFGIFFFLVGFGITFWLLFEKVYYTFLIQTNYTHITIRRDVVENTSFYIGLTSIIIGVQLFLAGFLAEMITTMGNQKNNYIIKEKIQS
ncbi:MAG: glycosyltransferase family 2 protein [Chitinophagaceae bacterium]|nr:glycosyltransferase family 2 protein [Chitinophagaceae bacterium]